MWRHEFQPGRCISGLVLITVGALYAGDALGEWTVAWFLSIPLVAGGLTVAGMTGLIARTRRNRRRERGEAAG